jgi:hypothetical protein
VNRKRISPSQKRKKPILTENVYLGNSAIVKKLNSKLFSPSRKNTTGKSKSMKEYEAGIKQIELL